MTVIFCSVVLWATRILNHYIPFSAPEFQNIPPPSPPTFFFFFNLFLYAGDYCMYTSLYKNIITVTNFLHPHLCVIKKSLCSPGIYTPNSYTSFLAPLLNRVL